MKSGWATTFISAIAMACARRCSGTRDRNAGFSTATPARLYSPVIMDPVWGYEAVNVEAQQSDPSSLLNWMRNMIALRKLFQRLRARHDRVSRSGESQSAGLSADVSRRAGALRGESFAVCAAGRSGSFEIGRNGSGGDAGLCGVSGRSSKRPTGLTLAPYSFLWLELQPRADASASPASDLSSNLR